MTRDPALHAFAAYGIELEYMIADRRTLSVLPVANRLLRDANGSSVSEIAQGSSPGPTSSCCTW